MSTLLPVRTIGMFSQTRTKSWNVEFYGIIILHINNNNFTKYTLLKIILTFSENCLDNFFGKLSQLGLILSLHKS